MTTFSSVTKSTNARGATIKFLAKSVNFSFQRGT